LAEETTINKHRWRLMNKQQLHQLFVARLTHELESITAAAKASFATATDNEHHAEGKYDTFSLETSYLARGQAKRVAELRESLERLAHLPLKAMVPGDPIQWGALVRLEADDGERRNLLFCSAGGGEKVSVDDEDYVIITSQSPLGRALLGRTADEHVQINIAGNDRTFTIISVE
jgi:transcription elongation GreA/GreB family factor